MARRSRLTIAKADIVHAFQKDKRKIFKRKDLSAILDKNRKFWRLTESLRLSEFISYLVSNTPLQKVTFKLPHRPETRFVWGKVSQFNLAVSMKAGAYLSHYGAVALHELTDQVPKTVYVNHEQRPQFQLINSLSQERIDNAFGRPQRTTSNFVEYEGFRYCYVNGKHTDRLGVIQMKDMFGVEVPVTSLERTLIDITVRPMYAGGISEVIEAYRRAHGKLSLNRLAATLLKFEYIYPYAQAVGFLLERSGYDAKAIKRHKVFQLSQDSFKFYLVHGMKDKEYDAKWRLFIPKGF